jgi:hypothetical protein
MEGQDEGVGLAYTFHYMSLRTARGDPPPPPKPTTGNRAAPPGARQELVGRLERWARP